VHTAPGHGMDDYITGGKSSLPPFAPVDDAGKFTAAAGPQFAGLPVLSDGTAACVDALRASGNLLLEETYAHKRCGAFFSAF